MKKNILTVTALLAFVAFQAQIQINNGSNAVAITNSNVMIDGSTAFSTEAGAGPNVGKGIIIPSVDLVNFQFDLSLADGVTFPTYFDGMIVYNNATGNTLTTGNRPSASLAVTPGYYYFSNPSGASNGNVTGGQWKALGGTASGGDNLGNHSATQNLVMNDNAIRLRASNDPNHGIVYTSSLGGPRLWGDTGGALGTVNGTNALTWDSNGNVISKGTTKAGQGSVGTAALVAGSSATENGYLRLTRPDQSSLLTIGGYSVSDVIYSSSTGIHTFNKTVKATAQGGAASLVPGGSTSENGYIKLTRPDQSDLLTVGGFSDGNVAYIASAGTHNFNAAVKTGQGNVGTASLVPGGSLSENGYLRLTRPDQSSLLTIGGYSVSDVLYNSSTGIHSFNKSVKAGQGNVGTAALVPGNSASENGYIKLTRPDQSSLLTIGGFSDGNVTYIASAGIHNFNTVVKAGLSGVGTASLVPGSSTSENGYLRLTRPDQSNLLTIGGFSDGNVTYIASAGIHNFNTTIQTPRVQGPSDRRFKKDITPIYNATEKLNQLNGYTYTWRDKKEFPGQTLGEGKDMGVIAQEVEKVFPDAVQTNKDGYKSVNYNALIPVLIEALKESNKEIRKNHQEIEDLKNRMKGLKK